MDDLCAKVSPLWWMELNYPPQALPLCLCVGVPGTFPSKTPRGEWGAVSQAADDPILAHMCAITVGAQSVRGRAGECHSDDRETTVKAPLLANSHSANTFKQGNNSPPQMVALASSSREAALQLTLTSDLAVISLWESLKQWQNGPLYPTYTT